MVDHSRFAVGITLLFGQLVLCGQWADVEKGGSCPPWRAWNNATQECVCLDGLHGLVQCSPESNKTQLLYGYCMTYDHGSEETSVGQCPYPVPYSLFSVSARGTYLPLPLHTDDVNDFMCGRLNRDGQLCAQCKKSHGSGLISYDLHCRECKGPYHGWALYLFLELMPISIFFLLVVILHTRVATPSLNAVILTSQMVVAISMHHQLPVGTSSLRSQSEVWLKFYLAACGVWNLDFFNHFIPSFCVSAGITGLQALVLQYLPIVYLLTLTALTWMCIELHGRNFRLLVLLWRPFQRCFARFNRSWNPRASLLDAFVTFLLLSYSRTLLTSFNLLYPTEVYTSHRDTVSPPRYYCHFDGDVLFFSMEHLPFAITAILWLILFNVLPMLFLIFYPLKCVQRCLSATCPRLQGAKIYAFSDAFQGYYKDNYRFFAGLYLLLRVTLFLSHVPPYSRWVSWLAVALQFQLASLSFLVLRPYKENKFNVLDGLIFALYSVMCALHAIVVLQLGSTTSYTIVIITHTLGLLPLAYLAVYLCIKLVKLVKLALKSLWKSRFGDIDSSDPSSTILPDRILRPERYKELEFPATGSYVNDSSEEEEEALLAGSPTQGYGSMTYGVPV